MECIFGEKRQCIPRVVEISYILSVFPCNSTCYYDYQLSKARQSLSPSFNVKMVLLSRATDSVSSGNLSAFDVISSKARETTY